MSKSTDEAVTAAEHAFVVARLASPAERVSWLTSIAAALEAATDELLPLADEETHLGLPRLRGELVRTVFQVRLLADEVRSGTIWDAVIDHADPAWPMGPRPDIRRINEPLGVVGVFGASNFPFAFSVMGGDSASALAAGCSVVHKAHPAHARLARRTGEIVVEALAAAGAPDGLFSLIEGQEAGIALVEHPLVKAVGFTGSTRVGRALFDRAVARPEPIPFFGELGSTNPVFVSPRAWEAGSARILAEYLASVTLGMGQFCTKPGFILVPKTGDAEVAALLAGAATAISPHALLTPGLRRGFEASVEELGGRPQFTPLLEAGLDGDAPRVSVFRTTAQAVLADPTLLDHEMFGPASVIVEYDDESELVTLAEQVHGQLTTSVQAEDDEDLSPLLRVLERVSGRVLWNGWPTGVTVSYAQNHGGPYPATTASGTTSVGTAAIGRFLRPVAYQGLPDAQLPAGLREDNPWGIARRVDGVVGS